MKERNIVLAGIQTENRVAEVLFKVLVRCEARSRKLNGLSDTKHTAQQWVMLTTFYNLSRSHESVKCTPM